MQLANFNMQVLSATGHHMMILQHILTNSLSSLCFVVRRQSSRPQQPLPRRSKKRSSLPLLQSLLQDAGTCHSFRKHNRYFVRWWHDTRTTEALCALTSVSSLQQLPDSAPVMEQNPRVSCLPTMCWCLHSSKAMSKGLLQLAVIHDQRICLSLLSLCHWC